MAIFLTLLYVLAAYLTPATLFGQYAQAHIQVGIAVATLLLSLFHMRGSGLLRMPQTYAILAMIFLVGFSMILNDVASEAPAALLNFIPTCIVFFFVVLNFRTRTHLQLLVLVLFLAAAYTIYQGAAAQWTNNTASPFVLTMQNAQGQSFLRSRGLGFLNDPNDLSQFLVGLIPCMFLFWRSGKLVRNVLLVILPNAFLLYGMFLTHSRGAMIAVLAAAMMAGRRKIGLLPAAIAGGVLFVGLSAVGWSGGRDVNADSGSDRMEAWSTGLQLLRSHPLFGVGYERFTEFFYITAHNTIVVTAAELGMVGLFCWLLMMASTVRDASLGARPATDPKLIEDDTSLASASLALPEELAPLSVPSIPSAFDLPDATGTLTDDEIRRMCSLMVISLTGFLTAGWFLSRSYTMVLFVNVGLAAAIYRLASQRGIAPGPLALGQAAKLAGWLSIALIALVYLMLRLDHLLPH